MQIDIEKLRKDLIDYYGTAMNSGLYMAIIQLNKVENASEDELLKIAKQNCIDITKYLKDNNHKRIYR